MKKNQCYYFEPEFYFSLQIIKSLKQLNVYSVHKFTRMENVKTRYLLEYVVLKPFSIIFSTKKNNHNKTRRDMEKRLVYIRKVPFRSHLHCLFQTEY